jgi:DNA repair exonuclease SbcCD ATPase subunit
VASLEERLEAARRELRSRDESLAKAQAELRAERRRAAEDDAAQRIEVLDSELAAMKVAEAAGAARIEVLEEQLSERAAEMEELGLRLETAERERIERTVELTRRADQAEQLARRLEALRTAVADGAAGADAIAGDDASALLDAVNRERTGARVEALLAEIERLRAENETLRRDRRMARMTTASLATIDQAVTQLQAPVDTGQVAEQAEEPVETAPAPMPELVALPEDAPMSPARRRRLARVVGDIRARRPRPEDGALPAPEEPMLFAGEPPPANEAPEKTARTGADVH